MVNCLVNIIFAITELLYREIRVGLQYIEAADDSSRDCANHDILPKYLDN